MQPETGWKPRPFSSFEGIVQAVINHRKGNQSLLAKGLSTEHREVQKEVEEFNVKVCQAMGWTGYIETDAGGSPPKSQALSQTAQSGVAAAAGQIRKIWAGLKTLDQWIDSGGPAVAAEESERRAAICVQCPLNGEGDFTKWFTIPASEAIRRQIGRMESRKLTTSHDSKLGICTACLCPMKLKVHAPFEFIKAHLSPEVIKDLDNGKNCWILELNDK